MNVTGKLFVFFLVEKDEFKPAGEALKSIEAESIETAEEEACEWVRRNRMSNPEHPNMRYRVELFIGDTCVWRHDETVGDPILEPTGKTAPSCPIG